MLQYQEIGTKRKAILLDIKWINQFSLPTKLNYVLGQVTIYHILGSDLAIGDLCLEPFNKIISVRNGFVFLKEIHCMHSDG